MFRFAPNLAFCALLTVHFTRLALSAEPLRETPITELDRDHWAFKPLKRPAVPPVKDGDAWAKTPVDAFILQRLEVEKVTPQAEAQKQTLLRRVTFDLTGLPPTPEEMAAFEQDRSPDAYEKLVERLLASPRYGERWGQHWLDLARFAETDGFEHDKTRPSAWKYRDWVIGAINGDLPYDEFVALQLAGDELRPGDAAASVATMFCLSGPDMPDINDQALRRHDLLNEMAGTVSATFLALQLGCAQCHDHKYDPVSQADFFRLRAVFDPAVQVKRDQLVGAMKETSREAKPAHLYLRGDVTRPGPEIDPGFVRVVNVKETKIEAAPPEAKSTGRRAALAQWLTDPQHPLTARVVVNRLWQHHFGRGLSTTPSDFGVVGAEPTHPQLLDWLAMELVDHGWSLKHVQRLIVTSAVYRQAGAGKEREADAARSPDLYAAFPRRRLEAEAIRDAMLTVSGEINLATGGPGVMPPLPAEIEKTLLGGQWKTSANVADHARRSVYVFARRNLRFPLLQAFDRPDANQACAARHPSTTAPQALTMLNSEFSLAAARKLAGSILRDNGGDTTAAIEPLFVRVYGRGATASEQKLAGEFLASQTATITAEKAAAENLALPEPKAAAEKSTPAAAAAFVDLCLALLNTSEFVYVD